MDLINSSSNWMERKTCNGS